MTFTVPTHRKVSSTIALPAQDQCNMPTDIGGDGMRDFANDNWWTMYDGSTLVDEGSRDFAYNNSAEMGYSILADHASAAPMKTWGGAFTVMIRAYGVCNGANAAALWGDMGSASNNRGTAGGPRNSGEGNFYVGVNSTTIVSCPGVAGMHSSTPTYRDYTYIFEPSVRIAQYRDEQLMSENTTNIPPTRRIHQTYPMRIGNRGDRAAGTFLLGRVKFSFFYKRVLTPEERMAVWANPIYVPGGG